MFAFFTRFIKHPRRVIIAVVVVTLVIIGYRALYGTKAPVREFVVVKKGDVRQEVSVTGRVKPAQNVDLAFEKSARVASIFVDVGSFVERGQTLIQLADDDVLANLESAKADVRAAQARLDELQRGTRPEEIQLAQAKVESANISLEDAKANLNDQLKDSFTKADDAVRNKTDQLFENPRSANPRLTFITDFQRQTNLESSRPQIETLLNAWMSVDSHVVRQNLNIVKAFLDEAALAVNILQPSSSLSQTTIDKYKADISSARTNINIAIANVTSAEEKFSVAQSNLLLAQNELVLKQAGNVPEQIASQEAAVAKAQASVSNAEAQLTKTVLRAPIGGIVTRQDAKVGQIVAPNIAIVSLASVADFQIEAAMPEADIAKIAIGQEARVTLDAYGSDLVFNAKVVKIDPAETIIDGVSTYKVTLQFVKNDNHIKSGMTANIDIEGEVHTGVLSVPQRVVVSRDSDKFVNILDGDNVREVKVKTGLRGSDGSVEILEGLREGDKVLTSYAAQ